HAVRTTSKKSEKSKWRGRVWWRRRIARSKQLGAEARTVQSRRPTRWRGVLVLSKHARSRVLPKPDRPNASRPQGALRPARAGITLAAPSSLGTHHALRLVRHALRRGERSCLLVLRKPRLPYPCQHLRLRWLV